MVRLQLPDREVVRDHVAVEPPLLAQDPGEELAIGRADDAVDLVVRVHHGADAADPNGCLERMEVHLPQLPRRDAGRRPVHPAVRGAVPDEVLRRRDHAVAQRLALQPLHERDAHPGDEIRILAERLLGAAPARIAAHVEDGSEAVVRADRAHLAADRLGQRPGERRVPGARKADRLREDRRVARHQPGADLLVDDRGDAEPGLLDEVALDRVGELRRFLGAK